MTQLTISGQHLRLGEHDPNWLARRGYCGVQGLLHKSDIFDQRN
jgi:hypothetical protein